LDLDALTLSLLQRTAQYFLEQQKHAYLVGGSIRNLLLNEPCTDWDIITDGDVPRLARGLANTLGGYYAHLHDKASRVIMKTGEAKDILFDVSPLHGNAVEDDLRQRDFTINAIAAPLTEGVRYMETIGEAGRTQGITPTMDEPAEQPRKYGRGDALRSPWGLGDDGGAEDGSPLQFIDPLNGLADIEARRLRAVNDEVFRRDPLRMLRAVRLAMRYSLHIDPATQNLIKRDAQLLTLSAAERIHDELYAILSPNGATRCLHLLDELGLLMVLIPEFLPARGLRQPAPHYWDVLEHSLEAVEALERLAMVLQNGGAAFSTPLGSSEVHWSQGQEGVMNHAPTFGHDENQIDSGEGQEGVMNHARTKSQRDLDEIRDLLVEAEQQHIFQRNTLVQPRMKLAALLHDIGKPATYSEDEDGSIHFYNHPQAGVPLVQQITARLNASTQDRRLAQLVTAHHMRPGQLGQDGLVTIRATRRYFVDLGPTGIAVALFSLADHLATLGPQFDSSNSSWERHVGVVRLLLTRYIRERESILPPRLLHPEELMRRLQLEPGPLVGQLLEAIAEAQAEGFIRSKEEAIWFAEEQLQHHPWGPD
jgi:poly(A) polymerase